ncbi:MAG: YggT family protein [Clostridia bacterium]|nr:YggT family protein [Clostridia bacterium]
MHTNLLYLLDHLSNGILTVLMLLFLLRVLMQFFLVPEENRLFAFSIAVTEIVVAPMRAIFDRFGIGEDSMIDLPFLASLFFLVLLSAFL